MHTENSMGANLQKQLTQQINAGCGFKTSLTDKPVIRTLNISQWLEGAPSPINVNVMPAGVVVIPVIP